MRSRPDGRTEASVVKNLAQSWQLDIAGIEYFPEGGGAYHWHVRSADGSRWFVTCDDLDTKPWLGSTRDGVFDRLCAAYATATTLHAAGASFVVAPTASPFGPTAVRISDRYSVAVFAHVDGSAGRWGEPLAGAAGLIEMLATLHAFAPDGYGLVRRPFAVPGRHELDVAVDELDQPWDRGPFSDPARQLLAANRAFVVEALAELDAVGDIDVGLVVTHGEPHPGNLIHTPDGLALVDWDTVALAPPERDMWMLAALEPTNSDRYAALTGRTLDCDLLAAYRLMWAVTDIAAFTVQLRAEHERNEDNERALTGLQDIIAGREPKPYG
jgi:spectinomycin phosphotransferase